MRNRDCGVFFRFRKKDKFCCSGVCDNGDRGRFSGSYTYAYGEWSVLQKRDPDRKFFRQCERTAIITTGKKYLRVKKQLLCVPDFRSIPKRSMILIGTALKILRSMFMRKLYRQKDFQIMKVRGGIFQIRFLLRQKGGGMLEKTP